MSAEAPLRIVSVCRSLPTPSDPAAGIFVLNRLAALSQQAQVRVLQPLPYLPLLKPLPAWARHEQQHRAGTTTIEHAPMLYLPGMLKSLDSHWLARSIVPAIERWRREGGVDLIDAHFGYPDGVGCVRVAQRLGLPVFVTIRGHENDFLKAPTIRGQLEHALRTATGVVSVSHSLRALAIEHGVDPQRIFVAPNAVDRSLFAPGERAAARTKLNLPQPGRLIVSVGHLVAGKRHHVLVQALASLRQQWPDVTLAVIGGAAYEPKYPEELRSLARELGVADHVRWVGRVPPAQVADWLRASDVFALATAREGCCNAVLEALATGVPVVTTPAGDNAYFVKDDVNGYLMPIDDVAAAAQALSKALQRSWDARGISAALNVGQWKDVASGVIGFFRRQLSSGVRAVHT